MVTDRGKKNNASACGLIPAGGFCNGGPAYTVTDPDFPAANPIPEPATNTPIATAHPPSSRTAAPLPTQASRSTLPSKAARGSITPQAHGIKDAIKCLRDRTAHISTGGSSSLRLAGIPRSPRDRLRQAQVRLVHGLDDCPLARR